METFALILHFVCFGLFVTLISVKTWQLVTGKIVELERLKKATQIPEGFVILTGLISGIYLLTSMESISTLLWLKVGLICLAVPLGINAFRYHRVPFGPITLALLIASVFIGL